MKSTLIVSQGHQELEGGGVHQRGVDRMFWSATHVTGRDILANVPRHLRPPVVLGHQLSPSGVPGNFRVVAKSNDVVPKLEVSGTYIFPQKYTVAQKTAPMFAYYIKTHVLLNADMI